MQIIEIAQWRYIYTTMFYAKKKWYVSRTTQLAFQLASIHVPISGLTAITYLLTTLQQYMSHSPLTHGQMYTGEEYSCYKGMGSWSCYRTPGRNHILDLSKQKQHKSRITILHQLVSVCVLLLSITCHFVSISKYRRLRGSTLLIIVKLCMLRTLASCLNFRCYEAK